MVRMVIPLRGTSAEGLSITAAAANHRQRPWHARATPERGRLPNTGNAGPRATPEGSTGNARAQSGSKRPRR